MTASDDRSRPPGTAEPDRRFPLGYLAAAALAVPIGAIGLFEVSYLYFGVTAQDPPATITTAGALLAFGLALAWPLYRARRPAEVVRRSCQLGMVVALLLPAVTFAVLLIWQNAPDRPDLGMGGLMLYSLPLVAIGVAVVLSIAFAAGARLASKRLPVRDRDGSES